MRPLDIPAIEQHARELRAAEIQRIQGLFAARGALVLRLASESLLAGLAGASEALRPKLDAMQARGVIGGYDMAARYLPSIRTQRARQAALPQAGVLQTELDAALADWKL